jgi:hypothetical protein
LLAVVEQETGFVPPNIEALIRTKTIVGITNEVDILGDRRAVDAHVAYFSAFFTCYSCIDHFEMIEAQVLKLLHKKISLSVLLTPALVRGHLLNQFMSFFNSEGKERTSSSNIYTLLCWANQPMIEALDDEPLRHAMMGACRDIILQAFPYVSDGLKCELLKPEDLVPQGIGFAQQKNLARNALEHFSHVDTASLLE